MVIVEIGQARARTGAYTSGSDQVTRNLRELYTQAHLVTFWEALDQLCHQAEVTEIVQPLPAAPPQRISRIVFGESRPPLPPQNIVLSSGKPIEGPVCLAGSVRVRALPPNVANDSTRGGETGITLDISSEQRLQDFGAVGIPYIEKAIDDQGRTLTMIPEPIVQGISVSPQRTLPIRFKQELKPSKSLRELSGKLTLHALGESEKVLTVNDIMKAAGKKVEGKPGYAMQIQSVEKQPDNQGLKIDLTVGNQEEANVFGGIRVLSCNGALIVSIPSSGNLPQLIDAQGKMYSGKLSSESSRIIGGSFTLKLTLTYHPEGEPSQLVVFSIPAVVFEVPFMLRNVPLP